MAQNHGGRQPLLLIGSNNRGKLLEIQALLEGAPLKATTPTEIGLVLEVDEKGGTYEENAVRKAAAFAAASGLPTLADDSGLEVDALGGLPGINSARFAPQTGATDADRRAYLLHRLGGLPRPWTARFRCVIAVAVPGQEIALFEGLCPGEIIPEERGENGFGYDPIFLLPEVGLCMAELSLEEKNKLSHRARAVRAARPYLVDLFNQRLASSPHRPSSTQGAEIEREHLLAIQDDVRRLIAQELHDGPTQSVAAIALRANIARKLMESDPGAAQEELSKIEELSLRATKDIRQLIFSLRPLEMSSRGLLASLDALSQRSKELFNLQLNIAADAGVVNRLSVSEQWAVYYLVDAAVSSARKLSQVDRITVRLSSPRADAALLEIEDETCSSEEMPSLTASRPTRLLEVCQKWADYLNGDLSFETTPQKGSLVKVDFPLAGNGKDRPSGEGDAA